MEWDLYAFVSIILGIIFAYGLFGEETEYEETKQKRQSKKGTIPIKKNGRWIEKEID